MTTNAHHQALLAPVTAGPKRWTIPDLWRAAQRFVASMFGEHGDARALVARTPLRGAERNAILEKLIPAERLVRELLISNAITFLLMTPAGRRIRARAKPITPPAPPPPPPGPYGTTRVLTIPLNANLARHYRPAPVRTPRPPADPANPETWRVQFRILRWDVGRRPKPPRKPPRRPFQPPGNLGIARRIEALGRVTAAPRARMMRLARYLARLPKRMLDLGSPFLWRRNRQMQTLRAERLAAYDLAECAVERFDSS